MSNIGHIAPAQTAQNISLNGLHILYCIVADYQQYCGEFLEQSHYLVFKKLAYLIFENALVIENNS